jgi:hypothetical protein
MSQKSSSLAAVVAEDLQDRGFRLDTDGRTSVARGSSTTLVPSEAPLAIVSPRNSRPLTVISTIANAVHDGHVPVLVADRQTETEIEHILSDPFLLRDRRAGRHFFPIEDRIRLPDDSYACLGTTGSVEWFEGGRQATDEPQLRLAAGGETVTVLESVDALSCPGPSTSAFQYRYARGDDGQFRVFDSSRMIGRYNSIKAMRADGFRPLPLPLVPEHHVRDNGKLARATLIARVTGHRTVRYRSVSF